MSSSSQTRSRHTKAERTIAVVALIAKVRDVGHRGMPGQDQRGKLCVMSLITQDVKTRATASSVVHSSNGQVKFKFITRWERRLEAEEGKTKRMEWAVTRGWGTEKFFCLGVPVVKCHWLRGLRLVLRGRICFET